ncbi:hypothetical protein BDZ97DRAFT_280446 [Flammula alnicola]|nr:hypothetical protein BDZ97DRAFT_280446 [Flammula alnicola]
MSDLVLRECPICFESIPFERVLFLHCGHKICSVCIARCKAECVVCRKPILETPHRVYLSMDEIVQEKALHFVERLNKINVDTPATSVEKTSGKIERLLEKNGDPATVLSLMQRRIWKRG